MKCGTCFTLKEQLNSNKSCSITRLSPKASGSPQNSPALDFLERFQHHYPVTPQSSHHKENYDGFPGSFLLNLPKKKKRHEGIGAFYLPEACLKRRRKVPFGNEGWPILLGGKDPQNFPKPDSSQQSLAKYTKHIA